MVHLVDCSAVGTELPLEQMVHLVDCSAVGTELPLEQMVHFVVGTELPL